MSTPPIQVLLYASENLGSAVQAWLDERLNSFSSTAECSTSPARGAQEGAACPDVFTKLANSSFTFMLQKR